MTVCSLDDLLLHEINVLYDVETRLFAALSDMSDMVDSSSLKVQIEKRREECSQQIRRLEWIFVSLKSGFNAESCPVMDGFMTKLEMLQDQNMDTPAMDVSLCGVARMIFHYQAASYATCRNLAAHLKLKEVCALLDKSMLEKVAADGLLSCIEEKGWKDEDEAFSESKLAS